MKYLKLVTAAQNNISCEADLICRRVVLFTTNYSLSVCPLNRAKLGVDYKQRNSCFHTTHIGKGETFKSVDCLQSKQILEDHGVLVPFGSGKYTYRLGHKQIYIYVRFLLQAEKIG